MRRWVQKLTTMAFQHWSKLVAGDTQGHWSLVAEGSNAHRIEALLIFIFDHTGNMRFGAVPCGNMCEIWCKTLVFSTTNRTRTHSFSPGCRAGNFFEVLKINASTVGFSNAKVEAHLYVLVMFLHVVMHCVVLQLVLPTTTPTASLDQRTMLWTAGQSSLV
jgi:hypothetical protein